MEQIIQKAIEGGYNPNKIEFAIKQNVDWFLKSVDKNKIVLDPLFWQALGKACGWAEKRPTSTPSSKEEWFWHATKFHEINLTKGWEKAVAYLEELIK